MAKSKFSISENMLNGISKNVKKTELIDAKENFKLDYIDIEKIKVNSKNFYPIVEIESLEEDISINGLNHNLVVRPIDDELYEIISGERRYTALKSLVEKGEKKYKTVPCKIINLNDRDAEIVLIQANAQTRELTESDKLKQVERLQALYEEKKALGEKVSDIRGLISKDIGLSKGQVAKYTNVSNNLIPELRKVLDEGNLTISNATEFAGLSVENQNIILNIINKKVAISKSEAVAIKKKLKEVEEEKQRILERENQKSEEVNQRINELKKEILETSNKDKEELENNLEILESEKNELESEKLRLESSIRKSNEDIILEIEGKLNQKVNDITSKLEEDKLKLEKENKKLMKKLSKNNILSEEQVINQELKIRLNNTRSEISKIAGLMANNKIIDEDTLKLVKSFENDLRVLNEQILIYSNQEKIK